MADPARFELTISAFGAGPDQPTPLRRPASKAGCALPQPIHRKATQRSKTAAQHRAAVLLCDLGPLHKKDEHATRRIIQESYSSVVCHERTDSVVKQSATNTITAFTA